MTCEFTRKLQTRLREGFQALLTTTMWLLMRLRIRLPGSSQTRAEAFEWLMTLHSAADLDPHLPQFRRWLDARPGNRPEFTQLWEFWYHLDYALAIPRESDPIRARELLPERRGWGALISRRALGTVVMAALVVGGALYLAQRPQLLCNEAVAGYIPQCSLSGGQHSTGPDEIDALALSDGSSILLSGSSAVTPDFAAHRRHVRLVRGAARFEVAKGADNPFEVSVDGATVRALGTSFFIKRTGIDSARIEVTEGSVELEIGDEKPFRVYAGQVAEFEPQLIRLSTTPSSKASGTSSSPGTMLIFRGKSLGDAVREFNRYNPRHPIVVDERDSHHSVNGPFSATNPFEFAAAMAATWGMLCVVLPDSSTGIETIRIGSPAPSRHPAQRMRGHQPVEEQP